MSESVIVDTKCGKLRGIVQRSFEGFDYCAFRGVPYAKPPIGKLRFKDPLPPQPWSGIRDATTYGQMCGQMDSASRTIKGGDDCLYLNVYAKTLNPEVKLPVMVWIHGGAFVVGHADDLFYGPDYLVRRDIVLVTCNFRLGVLGFLNFDDEAAPGNQGLKDQVMVLKWVQENIANFGGDPNNVTLFGESSGGVCVHYLTLSSLTKGCVHKAISQSGVACNTWSCIDGKKGAYRISEILGNKEKDPKKLVEFLQNVDVQTLIEAQEKTRNLKMEKKRGMFVFGPGIDRNSREPLMPIHPFEAYKEGVHIPYIVGYNSRESIPNMRAFKNEDYKSLEEDFSNILTPVTRELIEANNLTPNELKRLYFGHEKISAHNEEKCADWYADMNFVDGIHRTLEAQVERSSAPTYFYRFSYDKSFSITKTFAKTSITGASHFDEVQYLFSMNIYDILKVEKPKPGSTAYRIIEQMTEMWTTFARHGRPTLGTSDLIPTYWLPVTDRKIFRALNIDEELRIENVMHLHERLSFGRHLKNKL